MTPAPRHLTAAAKRRAADHALNQWIATHGFLCPGEDTDEHEAFDLRAHHNAQAGKHLVRCLGCMTALTNTDIKANE